ncbi:putative tellurium resistance membrane protein TerC [Epilithonimonas hungarica]|nr:putative tellurium resistance membrane protein TerC [Epilithonimonas hungarica]
MSLDNVLTASTAVKEVPLIATGPLKGEVNFEGG